MPVEPSSCWVICRRRNACSASCHWSAIGPSDNGDGYDADWLRDDLKHRGMRTCIPPRAKRKRSATYDKRLYRKRHRIDNAFARLKDWRRIATRYDRCGDLFLSAICIAAIVIFWLPK
jgi:hypothetical protein